MTDKSSELRRLALEYKSKTKDELDALNLDNLYSRLLNDMIGLAFVGLLKYRISRDSFEFYGLNTLSIRDSIVKRLESDGFNVFSDRGNPLLLRNSYIEVNW